MEAARRGTKSIVIGRTCIGRMKQMSRDRVSRFNPLSSRITGSLEPFGLITHRSKISEILWRWSPSSVPGSLCGKIFNNPRGFFFFISSKSSNTSKSLTIRLCEQIIYLDKYTDRKSNINYRSNLEGIIFLSLSRLIIIFNCKYDLRYECFLYNKSATLMTCYF